MAPASLRSSFFGRHFDHRFTRGNKKEVKLPAQEALECRRLLSGYTISELANFNGLPFFSGNYGVVMDSSGNLFEAGNTGAPGGANTIFEFPKGSGTPVVLAQLTAAQGGPPTAPLLIDSAGNLYGTTAGEGYNGGVVFELAKGANVITTLASLNDTGVNYSPMGPLALDSVGNLFGTTGTGGANGNGTVFEVVKGSGVITTLDGVDSPYPGALISSVLVDDSDNLYGEISNNTGEIYELPKGASRFTILATFDSNRSNGFNPYAGLLLDSAGNLYGGTSGGGASDAGTVFEVVKGSGAITTLASFTLTSGNYPSSPLIMDAEGNLFGATSQGGDMTGNPNGNGTIFEVSAGSGTVTTLFNFNKTDGSGPYGPLSMDAAGDIYGTTNEGGDNNQGTLFDLTPPATQLAFTATPYMAVIGVPLSPAVTVDVENFIGYMADDNSTVALTIASGPAGGTLNGTVSATAANGVATFDDLSFSAAGVYTLTATDGALWAASGSFFVSTPGTIPARLAFTALPPAAVSGTIIAPAITVSIEDVAGNVVVGDNSAVTLTISSGPGGATLDGATTATAVNGVATFANLSIDPVGTYTLTAIDGALTPIMSSPFEVKLPSPAAPAFGLVSLPAVIVAGSTFKANMPVFIRNGGSAFKGDVTINIYADGGMALDGKQVLVAAVTKNISLDHDQGRIFKFNIASLPSMLAVGTYHLLAETVAGPKYVTSMTAMAQAVNIEQPFIEPTASVGAVIPATITRGKSGSFLIAVTNIGNVAASGVDITLSPSTDGVFPVADIVLQNFRSSARIQPNQSKTFKVRFKVTSALAAGTYFPYVSVSLGNASTSVVGTATFRIA